MAMDFSVTTSWGYEYAQPSALRLAVSYATNTLTHVSGLFTSIKLIICGTSMGDFRTPLNTASKFVGMMLMKMTTLPTGTAPSYVPGVYSAFMAMRAEALAMVGSAAVRTQYVHMFEPYLTDTAVPSPTYAFWS